FGSAAPVEDPDPLRGIWAAVTRRPWPSDDPEEEAQGPWHPEHALSVVEALRAYTQGPARAVGEGSRHGGLRPGMPGDVALLAPDPVALERALPPGGWTSDDERAVAARHHLSRVRVVATVVAGRIAHTA
ncbi:MAG: amidohydrolase family protein, partial [Firmicutes bacterium]|nr:amidohydrolase family protein [Bacillota bacterium]